MNNQNEKQKTDKVMPDFLDRFFGKAVPKVLGKMIPNWVTPNTMTMFGAIGALIGVVFAALAYFDRFFLIGTCAGVLTHLICDNLDGYIARKNNKTSTSGAYFDLLTDILHVTFLLIALSYAGVISFYLSIFMVPVYALIIFTSMNEIHYLNKFTFPSVGPSATHLFLLAICIGTMIFGKEALFEIKGIGLSLGNIICVLGGIVMYVEMIKLQISVFVRLKRKDNEGQ